MVNSFRHDKVVCGEAKKIMESDNHYQQIGEMGSGYYHRRVPAETGFPYSDLSQVTLHTFYSRIRTRYRTKDANVLCESVRSILKSTKHLDVPGEKKISYWNESVLILRKITVNALP
mmetsp:Transcript_796/g.1712  ORF Transcript_796/g.1712 Transcript_796/m.1712 type:complete len:117 (-) Transcript_796:62-412(-)